MNKSKSVFVAALMAAMVALITAECYLLKYRAWIIIAAGFAVYGFLCGAAHFSQWLTKEPPLLPPKNKELGQPDEGFTQSYDEIIAEFQEEKPSGGGNA